MRKGKHRRHQQARELKQRGGEAASRALGLEDEDAETGGLGLSGTRQGETLCEECSRSDGHADWCRAERY